MSFGIPDGIQKPSDANFWNTKTSRGIPMCAQATRLSELKIRAAKPLEKDYVLVDGDGLQMRARINGSRLWDFN